MTEARLVLMLRCDPFSDKEYYFEHIDIEIPTYEAIDHFPTRFLSRERYVKKHIADLIALHMNKLIRCKFQYSIYLIIRSPKDDETHTNTDTTMYPP